MIEALVVAQAANMIVGLGKANVPIDTGSDRLIKDIDCKVNGFPAALRHAGFARPVVNPFDRFTRRVDLGSHIRAHWQGPPKGPQNG